MSGRIFVSVLAVGAVLGFYIGALVQHAPALARAYQRGYEKARDSVTRNESVGVEVLKRLESDRVHYLIAETESDTAHVLYHARYEIMESGRDTRKE